jgi:hypothetical protein
MFVCQVRIVSRHRYKTIYVSSNLTHLIKCVRPINHNLLISYSVRVGFVYHVKNCHPLYHMSGLGSGQVETFV